MAIVLTMTRASSLSSKGTGGKVATQRLPVHNVSPDYNTMCHDVLFSRDEILGRFKEYDGMRAANRYTDDELRERDPRIHCCFYVMAPHRIHEMDLRFMKQLHLWVPLVPIIGE